MPLSSAAGSPLVNINTVLGGEEWPGDQGPGLLYLEASPASKGESLEPFGDALSDQTVRGRMMVRTPIRQPSVLGSAHLLCLALPRSGRVFKPSFTDAIQIAERS